MKVFKESLSLTICKVNNKINNINIMWNNLHFFAILYVGKPMEKLRHNRTCVFNINYGTENYGILLIMLR